MDSTWTIRTRGPIAVALATIFLMALAAPLAAHEKSGHEGAEGAPQAQEEHMPPAGAEQGGMQQHMPAMPGMANMRMPTMNSARGKILFVEKGCVACHAINGVGGHDATALDAHSMPHMMNPFDFAAKMWRMAPAMIYAQEEALGEQILFTGDELADIIAFVHDDAVQHTFTETDIPPRIRKLMHHTHGEPGSGAAAHGEELGHQHGMTEGMHGHEEETQ